MHVLPHNLRKFVFFKIKAKKHITSIAKSIKKTFKLNEFFFSKVFFLSFYKFIIVTIKVFNRFYKFKKQKRMQFVSITSFF